MSCNEENRYDFAIQQGDDVVQPFRYLADGVPVDLTGSNFVFECTLASLTHNMTVASPTTGEVSATFDRADTAGLDVRRVRYEVVQWHGAIGASQKETVFWGSLNLTPEAII